VAALATGQNPGLLAQLATGIAANGLLLAHSRADETEADEFGVRYASAAGYDPHALSAFFRTLQAKEGRMPGALVFLSDHPATGDRIGHIEQVIAAKHLGGSERNEQRYLAIRARVLAHVPAAGGGPPPPPPPPGAPPAPRPSSAPPPPPPPPPPPKR
jgi:predicted Zn-dependent protease